MAGEGGGSAPPGVFLGVDGGGTTTALALVRGDGVVLARADVASSYYFGGAGDGGGVGLVERVLREGVEQVCAAARTSPAEITSAFFGLPGYGESSADLPALDAAPRAVLGHGRCASGNDMVCGWAGSLAGEDGVNVICGTGSMAYGENGGRRARAGGWGELFGDEGSAYWIAVRGLAAFSRMSDGREEPGPLLEVVREHLGLAADLDLVDVVLGRWQGARTEVAALAPLVTDAAARGDAASGAVLDAAAHELAATVAAVRSRLAFDRDQVVPVSYSGGVFSAGAVVDRFRHELAALPGAYELRRPLHEPVVGAALYAARLAGTPFDRTALARLRAQPGTTA